MLQYLISSGYMQTLSNLLEIRTIFAPTDRAFEKLSNATKERMETDKKFRQNMIGYHVAYGKLLQEKLPESKFLKTSSKDTKNNNIRLHFGDQMVSNFYTFCLHFILTLSVPRVKYT